MSARFFNTIALPVLAAGFLANACSAGEAPIQTPPSHGEAPLAVEDVIGYWRVSPAMGAGSCLIALNRFAAGDGYGVHIETCSVASLAAAQDWRPVPGGFELRDKAGATIVRFRRTGVERFIAVGGAYRMEPAAVT